MSRTKSSSRWLKEHFDDPYVKRAQQEGYRARAVYKLLEINDQDHILRPGMSVVDLGAAPGGWSQVAARIVGEKGRVIALDILPMEPINRVEVLQGDFTEQAVLDSLLNTLAGAKVDLVMSDMAPNISGMRSVDQPRAMYLAELALDLARKVLAPGGDLLIKVFQGGGFDELYKELRLSFKQVIVRKPKASRPRTREVYLLARGFQEGD
ncbi:MAG TPA: 23S rRNA (uridine(2552)-2'-O)-methyltransferase RlmE [Gammaproteobacteria bacterium]|nr:23S rRNA (uridine(2552)-2'-O)-methyltransferase RlmE [Gammaproteobacteria bacterium]